MLHIHTSIRRLAAPARRKAIVLAAGAAVSVGMLSSQAAAQFVWTGTTTGTQNFSNPANWQGTAPTVGDVGNAANTLTFTGVSLSTTGITATQDLGSPSTTVFKVNKITFDLYEQSTFSVRGSPTTNSFQFTGPTPMITVNGYNPNGVNFSTGAAIQLTSDLTINGNGLGNISFLQPISDDFTTSGIRRSITITGTPATLYARTVNFNNTMSYSGGLNLDGANLEIQSGTHLGPAGSTFTVTPNGGVLGSTAQVTGMTVSNIQLDGQLRYQTASTTNVGPSTTIAGSGKLLVNVASASNGFFVQSASINSGDVTVDRFDMPNCTGSLGGVALQHTSGSMLNVNTFNIRAGGFLWGNNAYITSGLTAGNTNSNRISDTATLNLGSSIFRVSGSGGAGNTLTAADVSETVGTVNGSGMPIVWAESSASATKSTTINVGTALNRVDNGTFVFRGTTLGNDGGAAGVAGVGYINVPAAVNATQVGGGGAAGSTTMSILPYAVVENQVAGSTTRYAPTFAVVGPSGVRGLAVSEYAAALGGGPQDNVLLAAPTVNAGSTALNALLLGSTTLNGASPDGSVSGGTLDFSGGAGAIIASGNTAAGPSISSNVHFGSVEGKIYTTGGGHLGATGASSLISTNQLTISGNLTGTNGLTKFGGTTNNNGGNSGNVLVLTGDNSGLSGPLTLNAGFIDFNSAAALPGSGTIVSNGSHATTAAFNPSGTPTGLAFSGANTTMTLTRDIAVNSGWMNFKAGNASANSNATMTSGTIFKIAGQITGQGGVNLLGNSTNGNEIWITGTNNTYTGPTRIQTGVAHIVSDGSLGNGGALGLEGGTLKLEGNWTTSRLVNITSTSTIDTNGFSATLNGAMTSYANNLTGTGASTATATFTKAGAGTMTITSNVNTVRGTVNVNGGTLLVNGTLGVGSNLVNVNTGATLGGTGAIYRNTTVASGGTLAPGASAGILTEYGNLTLASGSNFSVELNGAIVGSGYDRMVVNGTVGLTGSNLLVALGFEPSSADMFFILANDGADTITGTFSGLMEGDTVALGTFNSLPYFAKISYLGNLATGTIGTGNDVVLYEVIPAPGAASLLGLGCLLAAHRRRR